MSWRPNSGPAVAQSRAAMLRRVRAWFAESGVLEVATPALSGTGVTDPAIEALAVSLGDRTAWLHTSPEFCMKRLLAAGYPDIYQVGPVFRGGEQGRHHLPEFTMIEWYRLGFDLDAIIDDALSVAGLLMADRSPGKADVLDYVDAFTSTLQVAPLTAEPSEIAAALDAGESLRRSLGDDRDAWLDLAMATRIAPAFAEDRLTVVRHYPASQASLARLCPANPALADRFEIYLGPVELANGFVELTDPAEQRRRFERDRQKRAAAGMADVAVDDALMQALSAGLPECAGVALGLDRALMIAEGCDRVLDVTTFTPGALT